MASLILIPGLGTDHTLLDPQKAAFPSLIVPDLPKNRPGETLREYAVRLMHDAVPKGEFVCGGISFGGILALEAMRDPELRARCQGVLLIASSRSRHGIRGAIRMHRLAGRFVPDWVAGMGLRWFFAPAIAWANRLHPDSMRILRKMAEKSSIPYIRWGAQQTIDWDFEGPHAEFPDLPVWQLHGQRDALFPLVPHDPDCVVPRAGHLVNLSQADTVNAWIRARLEGLASVPDRELSLGSLRVERLDRRDGALARS